jgi:microcystin-dependent protein
MPDPQTPNKRLFTPAHGADVDSWDVPANANWNSIDLAFGGSITLNATALSGDQTLTSTQYTPLALLISGTPSAAITYVVPSGVGGQWEVENSTSGGQTVGIKSAAGGSTVVIPAASRALVSCDGTSRGMVRSDSAVNPGGSNTQVQYNSSGSFAGSANLTFDGTTLTSTDAAVTTLTLTTLAKGSPLTGVCFWFAGIEANIPANSLLCYGQAVSRSTYAALFAKIGTTWGSGDGSTTFNLPDMRGRVPAGADNEGGTPANRLGNGATGGITGAASLGATGGEQSHALISDENGPHTHTYNAAGVNSYQPTQGGGAVFIPGQQTGSSGLGTPHNTVQPTIVGNWIIFT